MVGLLQSQHYFVHKYIEQNSRYANKHPNFTPTVILNFVPILLFRSSLLLEDMKVMLLFKPTTKMYTLSQKYKMC